jgi:Condensation domain/AMP-binding enzyme/Phosphopantetheine attachment site/AMP-binding enzyme C-terminal domain
MGASVTWATLLTGATLCPFPIMENGVTGLSNWIREQRITVYMSAATLFRQFIRTLDKNTIFPDIRVVRLASDGANGDDFRSFCRHFPNASLFTHMLVSSEVGFVSCLRLLPGDAVPLGPLPIGRPVEGTEILLRDEQGEEVPRGAIGEIVVRSSNLSAGYWRDEALTAQRFRAGNGRAMRTFSTGDLARWNENDMLVFVGRKADRVKVRGYTIELPEVEDAIRRLPAIRAAVAAVWPRGNDDLQLVAYVIHEPDQPVTPAWLRRKLSEILPRFMIPSTILFVNELPLTANGKVDRAKLEHEAAARRETIGERPATPTESGLATIWAKHLNVQNVFRDDNFFDLGGDSLIAGSVAADVHSAMGVLLELRAFLDTPVLADLAESIDRARSVAAEEATGGISRISRKGLLPLSFVQERIWRFSQTPAQSVGYTVSTTYRIHGVVDAVALRDAMTLLGQHHEILRTSYHPHDDGACAIIHPPAEVELAVIDFAGRPDPEPLAEAFVKHEAARTYDLTCLPLFHLFLIRLRHDDYILLRVSHHILHDLPSWIFYLQQVAEVYEAMLSGSAPPPLPDRETIQYVDFAAWQRERMAGHVGETTVDWWRSELHDAPQSLALPFGRPEPVANLDPADGILVGEQTGGNLERLDAYARRQGATPFMVRLAGFAALLCAETGQNDVVIGSYVTLRGRAEFQEMLGDFSNLAMLRLRYQERAAFGDWLLSVRDVVLGVQAHREFPYEELTTRLRANGVPVPEISVIVNELASHPALSLAGARLTLIDRHPFKVMPWGFSLLVKEDGVECLAQFDANRYDPGLVRRMIAHYQRLLTLCATFPDVALGQLIEQSRETDARLEDDR